MLGRANEPDWDNLLNWASLNEQVKLASLTGQVSYRAGQADEAGQARWAGEVGQLGRSLEEGHARHAGETG